MLCSLCFIRTAYNTCFSLEYADIYATLAALSTLFKGLRRRTLPLRSVAASSSCMVTSATHVLQSMCPDSRHLSKLSSVIRPSLMHWHIDANMHIVSQQLFLPNSARTLGASVNSHLTTPKSQCVSYTPLE